MTKTTSILMLTTALCLPDTGFAQSNDAACRDLEVLIDGDLPEELVNQRDQLVTIIDQDDAAVCTTELTRIRAVMATSDTAATVADTAQTTLTLQDEVVVEGMVLLDQTPPQVSVQSGNTDVEIEPGSPTVTVNQIKAEIVVRQAPAHVTIDMPVPTIRIEQAAPQIIITMPDPNVTVGAAQPQVRVVQADPTIAVTQSPPKVDLQLRRVEEGAESTGFQVTDNRTGQAYQSGAAPEAITTEDADINFTASEPNVTLTEPTEQATVRIERNQPVVRFEQAEPEVTFASAGEPQIEFVQSGEPTVTFEKAAIADDAPTTELAETEEEPVKVLETEADVETDANAEAEADPEAKLTEDTDLAESDTMVETTTDVQLAGPMVERDGYNMVQIGDISTDTLIGQSVYGIKDEDIGDVGDLVLGDDGQVGQVLIEVGGFLGLGEKTVALPFDQLSILRSNDDDIRVYVNATEETLEAMPEYQE